MWNKDSFIELYFKPYDYEIVTLLLYEFGSDLKKSKITISLSDFLSRCFNHDSIFVINSLYKPFPFSLIVYIFPFRQKCCIHGISNSKILFQVFMS